MSPWKYYDSDWTGTSSTSTIFEDWTTSTTAMKCKYHYVSQVYIRRILIESPEHWEEEETVAFANLVNQEIHTGWQVTMIIKGEILITDSDIETRTMENFIPLLKKTASEADRAKINKFFETHPIGENRL